MKLTTSLFLSFLGFASTAVCQDETLLSKTETLELYYKLYLYSNIDSVQWKGDSEQCICGDLIGDIYEKAEKRINFFRLMNGLEEVRIKPHLNSKAQKAICLLKANNLLTHYPDTNMHCFSEDALRACTKSCLGHSDYKNFPETAFITEFIHEYGDKNYFAGHRRWLLYSRLREFGFGATDNTMALHTADGVTREKINPVEFIAYPWNGYVPYNLIYPKWSFSLADNKKVDFSKAVVSMQTEEGKEIQVEILPEFKNFLDPTLVWVAKGLFSEQEIKYSLNNIYKRNYLNRKIWVEVKGVLVDGELKDYKYSVIPVSSKIPDLIAEN